MQQQHKQPQNLSKEQQMYRVHEFVGSLGAWRRIASKIQQTITSGRMRPQRTTKKKKAATEDPSACTCETAYDACTKISKKSTMMTRMASV